MLTLMQPKEVFSKFKRRFSAEKKRTTFDQLVDHKYHFIVADSELQRDFREFLNSTGVPDLAVYLDFLVSTEAFRKVQNYQDLQHFAVEIYQKYLRSYATEKIQLDDFGSTKSKVEAALVSKVTPSMFDSASLLAYEKLKTVLSIFLEPYFC